MQSLGSVTADQLRAAGQVSLMKLEIYVGAAWVDLGTLDAKNYVEGASISLGGAGKTPDPVAGTWDATLSNENSIFHPHHPTSAYKAYNVTGRQARISIGGTYGGVDKYWQRMIGYMDEPSFSAPDYKVSISGGDYMKFLRDTEFSIPDNYWGSSATFNSIASDGTTGSELYNEADAMDPDSEADNVTPWTASACTFVSVADATGGSSYVGKVTAPVIDWSEIGNANVFVPAADTQYVFSFKYKRVSGLERMQCVIKQGANELVSSAYMKKLAWTNISMNFTTLSTDPVEIYFYFDDFQTETEFRFDDFSVHAFKPYWERYYELPGACTGPFRVILDGEDVWQGEVDEGWYFEPDAEPGPDPPAHPAKILFFDINKKVSAGSSNLVVHYFTQEAPENVVADILVKANPTLWADRAAALAAMDYTATGITIDKYWFKVGSTCLKAIKMLCERCDYRFHFKYDGTPVFKPKAAPGGTSFTFTDPTQIESVVTYQDRNEIKNRIVIEGIKLAQPLNREETLPSQLRGEAYDQTSIDEYGERTLTIDNHLFQAQAAIDAMKATLLAEYKDPKWYSDVEMSFNPVPLEMGDEMQWEERLSPVLDITQTGVIRDIKIDNFTTIYVCELP